MKPNEIKLRLIKVEGINVFFGKGIFDTETTICIEKSGFFLKRETSRYNVNSDHIKRCGNKAYCFVDLGTHQSINPTSNPKNLKLINQIQYLTQQKKWEANIKQRRYSRIQQLILIFCGMGVLFMIESIFRAIGVIL